MKNAIFFGVIYLILSSVAFCDECNFKYWEVISRDTQCDVFYLPDFEFRRLPKVPDPDQTAMRFCTQYEIKSKNVIKNTGYCYTGAGDSTGPQFEVNGIKYLADISFEGCLNDKPVQGIVFAPKGWSNAPKHLKRLWPVQAVPEKVTCAR